MTLFISTGGTLFHMAVTAALLLAMLVAASAGRKQQPPRDPYD